jgi:hypothetical protein
MTNGTSKARRSRDRTSANFEAPSPSQYGLNKARCRIHRTRRETKGVKAKIMLHTSSGLIYYKNDSIHLIAIVCFAHARVDVHYILIRIDAFRVATRQSLLIIVYKFLTPLGISIP